MDIMHTKAIDLTARLVTSAGVHWDPQRKHGTDEHWKAPPILIPREQYPSSNPTFTDLTNRRFGRFTVVGLLENATRKKKARWLVRCDCGDYEQRGAKAICNPRNIIDLCIECRHLKYIKEHKGRGSGVVTLDGASA